MRLTIGHLPLLRCILCTSDASIHFIVLSCTHCLLVVFVCFLFCFYAFILFYFNCLIFLSLLISFWYNFLLTPSICLFVLNYLKKPNKHIVKKKNYN